MFPTFVAQLKEGIDETVRALGEAFSENDDTPPAAAPTVDYAQHLDCDENDLRAIAEACYQDGDVEREDNEFEHAIELYTNGIGMQCNDEQLNATMYSNRAAVHFIMGNYDAALSDAKSAREFQPNHVEAFEIGASAYIELGLNKEAVTWCDDGLAIDHRNKKLRELKSRSLRLQAVQPGIDDDTLRGIADGYNKDGDAELRKNAFNNAIGFYTEGIQVNCKDDQLNALLYTNRATVHFLVGNYDDALSDAKCARKFRPTFLKAIVKGASACFELALFEETMHWCDDGLAIEKGERTLLELRERSLNELCELRKEERSTNVPVSQSQPLGFKDWSLQTLTELSAAVEEVIEQPTFIETHRVLYNVNRFKKAARVFLSSNNHDTADHESGGGPVYTSLPSTKGRKLIKDFFKLELSLNQNLGWKAGEGLAYHNLGSACIMDGDFKQAIEYHKQHLTIASERGDRRGEGMAYFSLGCVYFNLGDIDQAIDCLKLALSIAKEVGERGRVFEVEAHDILGSAYLAQDKYEEAQKHFEQNLQTASQKRDRVQEGRACGNLGVVYFYQGEWHKAVEYDNRFLSIAKDIGNREWEEEAYSHLGNAYHKLSEIEQAIHYYRLFLSITQEMSHREQESIAYLNLGGAFHVLRDFKQAAQYHRLYLNIVKELGDRCEEGRAYGCLSEDYCCLNDYKQAIEYGTLNLAISKEVGNKADEATAYHVLGNAFLRLGDFQKALSNYSLFLDAAKKTGDLSSEGCAYGLIGLAYQNLGCFEKAIDYHQRHLCIATEMGDILQQGCANGYIGCAYQSMGDSKQAIAFHENHLAIVKTEEESRGSEGYVYGRLGEAYLSLDDFERAIHYQTLRLTIAEEEGDKMEQGNAHYSLGCIYELLENLDEALLRFQSSVQQFQSVRALLQSRDEWKICFQDICQCANTALRRILLKQNKFGEALLVADEGRAQSLVDLMKSHYGIQAPFSESTPEKTVLDVPCSTLFLAIDDEENQINVWILLKNGDVYFRTTEIELGDQETNLKDYLNSFYMHIFKEFDILAGVRCEDRSLDLLRQETVVNANSNLELPQDFHFDNNPLRDLYDIIVEPVVDLIQGEELIIVPDGSLYLTPFCALLDSDSRFLCESFRLRVIPSLSSLRLIVSCSEEYHSRRGALLVGDPCLRDVVVNGIILKQLPYARIEVEQIGEILMTEPLIGTNATKDEVLRRLNSVSLVHIAAHGCSETGEIALSPNLTRESRIPESDDFLLTMADVLSVQMRARLVVLSCCHSGQGDVKAAEGVVGLARAFLASGARSVLVSLWAIDDEATLEFMKHFYQHLLVGRSSSQSLAQAMKCLRESKNYRSAKYWAPFVLIGDDVTFDFGKNESDSYFA